MIMATPVLFVGWKLFRGTRFLAPDEIDLKRHIHEIETYERNYIPQRSRYFYSGSHPIPP